MRNSVQARLCDIIQYKVPESMYALKMLNMTSIVNQILNNKRACVTMDQMWADWNAEVIMDTTENCYIIMYRK